MFIKKDNKDSEFQAVVFISPLTILPGARRKVVIGPSSLQILNRSFSILKGLPEIKNAVVVIRKKDGSLSNIGVYCDISIERQHGYGDKVNSLLVLSGIYRVRIINCSNPQLGQIVTVEKINEIKKIEDDFSAKLILDDLLRELKILLLRFYSLSLLSATIQSQKPTQKNSKEMIDRVLQELEVIKEAQDFNELERKIIYPLFLMFDYFDEEERLQILEELNPVVRGKKEKLIIIEKIVLRENIYFNLISPLQENAQRKDVLKKLEQKYQRLKNDIPPEAQKVIEDDFEKLKRLREDASSSEASKIYEHLIFLLELPWNSKTQDSQDFKEVRKILEEDHYGLQNIKKRILEFIAVMKLKAEAKGSILCFIGPPGVGKTSLGKSIARALGRKYIRISLGGINDEAEIRGHRLTYIGAKPGRVLEELRRAGVNNPVFMIDEIDKIGNVSGAQGNAAAALLEVLDPEQNFSFKDNYADCIFDLSKVFFICTGNLLEKIPDPLRDRMEIINLPGYLEDEKIKIARNFLIPKQLKENGLEDKVEVVFTDKIISLIINGYTDEAGVRELERKIAAIMRNVATSYVEDLDLGKEHKGRKKVIVNEEFIRAVLGLPKIFEKVRRTDIGEAIGLARAENGGCISFIEAAMFPSDKQENKIIKTGNLGEIFQEAVVVSLSLLKSRFHRDEINKNIFHVHAPQGAVPKEGPSAGVTIFCALYSLIFKKRVREGVTMTGEIDLKGNISAVGGIKEKIVAGIRAGAKEIILPKENEGDIEEVDKEIIKGVQIHLVSNIEELIKITFS